jgi:hypothetical protein
LILRVVRNYGYFAALALIFVVAGRLPMTGQSAPTGMLSGIVKDQTGAILPGVGVEVRNTGTDLARTAITDDVGRWMIPALPVGTYQVSFELPSFKKLTKDGVAVEASVTRTIDASLEVGAVTDTVRYGFDIPADFRAGASPGSDVDTQLYTSAVGGVRHQRRTSAGTDKRQWQYLAVREWNSNNEHQSVV